MSLRRSSALVMPFARAISSNASPRGRGTSVLTWTTGDRLLVTICAGCFLMSARPPCSWRRMTAASSMGPSASSMDRNLKLNSTAHQVGVKRFGLFHGAGIQAMYETRLAEIKVRRDISEKEDWLDRQGVEDRSLSAIWRTCLMPGPYRPSCRVPGPLCSYRHRRRRILQSPPSRSS